MKRNAIVSDSSDLRNPQVVDLNLSFISNRLDTLADRLIEEIFNSKKNFSLRTIIIIPSNTVKEFLIQQITKSRGYLFGLRFLTLPQAIDYFTKLTTSKKPNLPNHFALMFHLEAEIRKMMQNPPPDCHELIQYLERDEDKILSLSEEMSHVFLYYGLYGGEALINWKETRGWQQTLWREIEKKWDFPQNLIRKLGEPTLYQNVHVFDISQIPPLFRDFFDELSNSWSITYYFRSPTPLFWGDLLSEKSIARYDKTFEKRQVSENERLDF